MFAKAQIRPSINTLCDLRKGLRSGEKILSLASLEHFKAWDTLFKCAGRDGGDDLTAKTLRLLEIGVADHHDMTLCGLGLRTLPEFAEMCEAAIPHAGVKPNSPCGRPLSLTVAIRWLRAEGIGLREDLNDEASNVGVEAPTSGSDSHGGAKPKTPSPRRGRPRTSDRELDAKLFDAYEMCGSSTYSAALRALQGRFPNLTERDLRRAVDRHRKRSPK